MPANRNILPWKPINSLSAGKYFMVMNENIHEIAMQKETQPSLIFSGSISANTTKGSDSTPNIDTKTTNENDTSGMKLNAVTSTSHDLSIM